MLNIGLAYFVFGIILILAITIDLGLLSKKNKNVTIKKALIQTAFWISLSIAFATFLFLQKDNVIATKYMTAYLMEWSLSIDNIFVFILIFSFLKVEGTDEGRALLIGILLAIVFRILFISVGMEIIDRFAWVMYLFGAFLVYSGIKMFFQQEDKKYDPSKSKIFKISHQILRLTDEPPRGRFIIKKDGKLYLTSLVVVIFMLGATDVLFALDSIPTVVSLVRQQANLPFTPDEKMVIYSSNIFAVLGLRSLFFVIRNAVNTFSFLQQGISVVLVFIGVKMLLEFINVHLSIYLSLIVIVICLGISIVLSILKATQEKAMENNS